MSAYPGQDSLRTPLKVARRLGSSKTGVHHWWLQRVSAIALIPLSIWFLFLMGDLAHASYPMVLATIAQPLRAALLMVLSTCLFWHGALGLQVIIEDYVHTPLTAGVAHFANIFVCALASIAGVFAVLRIALGS